MNPLHFTSSRKKEFFSRDFRFLLLPSSFFFFYLGKVSKSLPGRVSLTCSSKQREVKGFSLLSPSVVCALSRIYWLPSRGRRGREGERERVRDSGGSAPANLRSSVGLFLPRENGPRFCVSVAGKRFRATTSKERSKVAVSRMRNFDRGQNFNFRVG